MNVYILTGIPGSGKTTWAIKKANNEPKTVIINRDSFRTMIKGNYVFSTDTEPLVKGFTKACVSEALDSGYDIIIDECNINEFKREYWIQMCRLVYCEPEDKVKIICVHFTEVENNLKNRMDSDARGYTEEKWITVINGMKENFKNPDKSEDFDEFITVSI